MNALTIENTIKNIGAHFIGDYGLKSNSTAKTGRIDTRKKTLGLMAIASDGKSQYFCIVDELSTKGLRLGQIPADFDELADSCTVTILTPDENVTISLGPRWVQRTNKGMYKTIGFQIKNPPFEWRRFIFKLKKGAEDLSFLLAEDEMGGIQ